MRDTINEEVERNLYLYYDGIIFHQLVFTSAYYTVRSFLSMPTEVVWRLRLYYPPEVSSMKYCCLGVFKKEYFKLIINEC